MSNMSFLPPFTRQRIEAWREDVADYLRDGTICQKVTESFFNQDKVSTSSSFTDAKKTVELTPNNQQNAISAHTLDANNMLSYKVDPHVKQVSQNSKPSENYYVPNNFVCSYRADIRAHSTLHSGRLESNHNNIQQWKIDRLVQGLPIHIKDSYCRTNGSHSKASRHEIISTMKRDTSFETCQSRPLSSQPRYHHRYHDHVYIASSNQNNMRKIPNNGRYLKMSVPSPMKFCTRSCLGLPNVTQKKEMFSILHHCSSPGERQQRNIGNVLTWR